MIATDRISAFDVILPRPIPYKGQILNQLAARSLKATTDIVPNWLESVPDPNVSVGKRCKPFPVEMVIRGYVVGHAWREYRDGKRYLSGAPMPDGLKENDPFDKPIITPTTKAEVGHDIDISKKEIIQKGLIEKNIYEKLEDYTYRLFERGSEMARKHLQTAGHPARQGVLVHQAGLLASLLEVLFHPAGRAADGAAHVIQKPGLSLLSRRPQDEHQGQACHQQKHTFPALHVVVSFDPVQGTAARRISRKDFGCDS